MTSEINLRENWSLRIEEITKLREVLEEKEEALMGWIRANHLDDQFFDDLEDEKTEVNKERCEIDAWETPLF